MDYFSKQQPIALPATVEPCVHEKEPLVSPDPEAVSENQTRPRRSRFKRALIVVTRLFLFGLLLRFVVHKLHKQGRHRHHGGPPRHHPPHEIVMFDDDHHHHHEKPECSSLAQWTDPEEIPPVHHGRSLWSSNTSFTLPASSESLLFLAHGSYAFGHIVFTEDDTDTLAAEEVAVDINVHHLTKEALERATVCTLTREVGDGVGIFTPTEQHHAKRYDELRFHVSVRLPKSAEIKDLKTILPMFAQKFLTSDVHFNTLNAHSINFPIFAKDLVIDAGSITTRNSPIKGSFVVTDSLEIFSSNTPIAVNVTMKNADQEKPTKLLIHTSNAPAKSKIALISTSSDGTGGTFIVDASTSNSPLEVAFADSPVDSVLHLSARTSNSPTSVHLHPAYEGTFHVKTSIFTSRVDVDDDVEDPSGEGRVRKVVFDTVGKEVTGHVYWVSESDDDDGDDTEKKGTVEVETSILPARLSL